MIGLLISLLVLFVIVVVLERLFAVDEPRLISVVRLIALLIALVLVLRFFGLTGGYL